ncbi:MAG TPA: hypothetical protein VEG34_17130 [Thermoanaerobaculia bacterium]|nr:hypothetical protein [Thermoanaerobaculia bacterium]
MKRALCLFTLAAALATGALAAAPLPAESPACPAPAAAALFDGAAPVFAADATAPKVAKCPRPGINCPDVYDPVICSNGQVYGNSCYAYVACATGCVSY